jgi:hypothetical protein
MVWSSAVALDIGVRSADDHINLKSLPDGRVFAVVKTSKTVPLDGPGSPLIMALVRATDGTWGNHTVYTTADDHTRAIIQLDTASGNVYTFTSAPCCSGGTIYYKQSAIDSIAFAPGPGTVFMQSASDACINNVSSTKQNVDGASELVVIAGADCTTFYMHNKLDLP